MKRLPIGSSFGKKRRRHHRVNHSYERRFFVVCIGESSATEQRDSECRYIARADDVNVRMRIIPRRRQGHSLDRNVCAAVTVCQRNHGSHRRAFNSRQNAHRSSTCCQKFKMAGSFEYCCVAQIHSHRQHAIGPKPRIDFQQAVEAFHHQARADEKNQRKRNFRNRQRAAKPVLRRAHARAAPAFFQFRLHIRLGRMQGWRQAKNKSSQYHHARRKQQHRAVQIHSSA